MPRIRTIKPDAFTSDTLSGVSVLARWTFAGLWTYCDDEGRARDDARLVKAALFPIDDDTSLEDVTAALEELCEVGAVCAYSVNHKTYLHCPKWGDHQKVSHPTPSKIPPCPEHSGTPPEKFGSPPETLRPERKGREQGTGKAKSAGAGSESGDFDAFWDAYPRKVAKGQARTAWTKAIKEASAETITLAAKAFATRSQNSDPKFIPYPATWLNGERWADEATGLTTDAQGRPLLPPLPAPFWGGDR